MGDPLMEVRIQRMFNRVWDTIGYDCLNALAEDKRKPIGAITMTRKHVIEVCWDYIDVHGGDKEACTALRMMPDKEADRVVKGAFQYARYGI